MPNWHTQTLVPLPGSDERVGMNLAQLMTVVAIADAGSIAAAAQQMRIAQPAVSRQIQGLERELGTKLFVRTRTGTAPTLDGTMAILRARRILDEVEALRSELQRPSRNLTGTVTLGVVESIVELLIPAALTSMAKLLPKVQLRVRRATSDVERQWSKDVADLAILYEPTTPTAAPFRPLIEDGLVLVGPPNSDLHNASPVRWEDALKHPLVLPTPGHGLRSLIDQALEQSGVRPEETIETNAMSAQKELVRSGPWWTILPATGLMHETAPTGLKFAPLISPTVRRRLVIGINPGAMSSASVHAVAAVVTDAVNTLVNTSRWPSAFRPSARPVQPRTGR
jgi:LysR family transcriptional regulator, nitrogen assimilation regulatory protein